MTDEELLAFVKQHLGVDFDDDDAEIKDLISAGQTYLTNAKGIEFDKDKPMDRITLLLYVRTLYKGEGKPEEQKRLARSAVLQEVLNKAIEEGQS